MPVTRQWKKSTRSGPQADCVELCTDDAGQVRFRDSKNIANGFISMNPGAYLELLERIKDGDFDRNQ